MTDHDTVRQPGDEPQPAALDAAAEESVWVARARELVPALAAGAAAMDAEDTFVADNYSELMARGFFAAGVPAELGGGGAGFAELCEVLRTLARGCGSTALALSMHTHLVCGLVWRLRQGHTVEQLLRRVASENLVLVSTGASDWIDSSGRAEQVAGGYRLSGRKIFGSGSPAGDLLMTSFPYDDPQDGAVVLHAAVPLRAHGVSILDNWRTLGMRGTGSHDIVLDGVFVPDEGVSLRRPKGTWHPFFTMVANVPTPLIMSVYLGIAEAAAAQARHAAGKKQPTPTQCMLVGELLNQLMVAQLTVQSMVARTAEYNFPVTHESASAQFSCKTIAAGACLATVEKAMEIVGGGSFFRSSELERLLRDVHAAQFHPLQEKRQLLMTGRVALGLDPLE
jgi:alkylation response protein AidB-like acyl-CoA dehydrogenase